MSKADETSAGGLESASWAEVGRKRLSLALTDEAGELHSLAHDVSQKVDSDSLTYEDLERLRRSLRVLQQTIEEDIAPVVDGTEPYERSAVGHIPPSKVMSPANLRALGSLASCEGSNVEVGECIEELAGEGRSPEDSGGSE